MAATPYLTYAEKKALKQEAYDEKKKFGFKAPKHLRSAKYVYYMPSDIEAIIGDAKTLSALLFGIEVCFKEFGPAPSLCKVFERDGNPGVDDFYINATGLGALFPSKVGEAPGSSLLKFVQHKDFRHNVYHVVEGDKDEFDRVMAKITSLTGEQFMYIINNARKFAGRTGVAVPVFYYKVVSEFDNRNLFISLTRYLDWDTNVVEAQYKLAHGLTYNRPWSVLPEHQEAYALIVPKWEAWRRARELQAKQEEEERQRFARVEAKWMQEKEEVEQQLAQARVAE